MALGGEVVFNLDFGRGPMRLTVHPSMPPGPTKIEEVSHLGNFITDSLQAHERRTIELEFEKEFGFQWRFRQ